MSIFTSKKKFNYVHKKAAEVQQHKLDGTIDNSVNLDSPAKKTAKFILFSGLDFKGQIQTALDAKGKGISGTGSIDLWDWIGWVGPSAEIIPSGSVKDATQRTLVALRGPKKIAIAGQEKIIEKPIVLAALSGKYWEAKGGLGIDLSIGVGAEVGLLPSSKGTVFKSEVDKFGARDNDPPSHGLEIMGINASMKLGGKLEGGYTYDHFHAEDLHPIACEATGTAIDRLAAVLEGSSSKVTLKTAACDFINSNKMYCGDKGITLQKKVLFYTSNVSSKNLIARLETIANNSKADKNTKDDAQDFISRLELYSKGGDKSCFLHISSHNPNGKAGVYGSIGVEANFLGFASGDAGAKAFAGVTGSYKRAKARFQTMVHTMPSATAGSDLIYVTYDSTITYSSFDFGLTLDIDAKGSVLGYSKSAVDGLAPKFTVVSKAKGVIDTANKKVKYRPNYLNQIRYVCAVAFWKRPDKGFTQRFDKELSSKMPRLSNWESKEKILKVDPLMGTGFSIGQSFTVTNLVNFYKKNYDDDKNAWKNPDTIKDDPYIKMIAKALRMAEGDQEKVVEFLADPLVYSNIVEYLPLDISVFIEATYAPKNLADIQFDTTIGRNVQDQREQIQLDKAFGKTLRASDHVLESIRLRYRKCDKENKDRIPFSLGFKLLGIGAKINLERVNRAGAEGMFDVTTMFFREPLKRLFDGMNTYGEAYEQAVPTAALFLQ